MATGIPTASSSVADPPSCFSSREWDELARDVFGDDSDASSSAPAVRAAAATSEEPDFLGEPSKDEDMLPDVAPELSSKFITLIRMAVMQAIARLRAHGVPVLRWHCDRAKEYTSKALQEWLTSQGIHSTMSAPEDHPANGRAEVAVREVKRWPDVAFWHPKWVPDTGPWLSGRLPNRVGAGL